MKNTLLLIFFFCASTFYAQEKNTEQQIPQSEITVLQQKVNNLQNLTHKQSKQLGRLTIENKSRQKQIESLRIHAETNSRNIEKIATELGTKIMQTETTANKSFSQLDKDVSKSRLFWVITILFTLILGAILYLILGKRIKKNITDVETQIKNTKKSLEEESIKLDSKLVEVLDTQLRLKQEKQQILNENSNTDIDHSLALKVADEIVRMQKNISKIDGETKGLKPLIKGIERIQANFASNGYEMINLLNKDYDERMNIDVINFITDENLSQGRKIITSVIKPQVNYNGVLIQRAQVDVSQN